MKGFTAIEFLILVIIVGLILGVSVNLKFTQEGREIKRTIVEIQNYTSAIKNFRRKYGFLPGDIKKTKIFELSINNTDGNQNGLIEDRNQQKGIYGNDVKFDGEIANFWLHLYNSGFIGEYKNIFPYIDFLKTGILVFTDGEKNYYHLGINGISETKEIETINNLTPNQAYLIDKKIDDGLPMEGKIFVYGGSRLNSSYLGKGNVACAAEDEYLTAREKKLCQLVMELDV